jgi:gamma-glutamyltranspeptidase
MIMSVEDKPTIAIGAAGGTKIPNALYEFFCNHLGEKQNFAAAVDAPRFNTIGTLDTKVEKEFPADQRAYLQQVGFKVSNGPGPFVSGVKFDPRTKAMEGRNHIGDPFETQKQMDNSWPLPELTK